MTRLPSFDLYRLIGVMALVFILLSLIGIISINVIVPKVLESPITVTVVTPLPAPTPTTVNITPTCTPCPCQVVGK